MMYYTDTISFNDSHPLHINISWNYVFCDLQISNLTKPFTHTILHRWHVQLLGRRTHFLSHS